MPLCLPEDRAVLARFTLASMCGAYLVWSCFDKLEGALGFTKRFGIVHVDFDS